MDLDQELLALTTDADPRARSSKRKRETKLRKSRGFSDSDGDSIEEGEENEDDFETAEDRDLKEVSAWGDDLMGDDEDRQRLSMMTEMEREQILAERAEKRQNVLDRVEVQKKLKPLQQDRRISSRTVVTTKTSKSKSLQKLKKRRDEKTLKKDVDPGTSKAMFAEYSEDEENDEAGESEEPSYKDETTEDKASDVLTLEDVRSATITRDELERIVYANFFEEAVTGPLSEGKANYRLARIADVSELVSLGNEKRQHETSKYKVYTFGQTATRKRLLLQHGKSRKAFTMDLISNSHITEVEIDEMLKAKQEVMRKPTNIAAEKIRLKRLLDEAEENNDTDEIEKLREELGRLDDLNQEKKKALQAKTEGLIKLSERNRLHNMTDVSKKTATTAFAVPVHSASPKLKRQTSVLAQELTKKMIAGSYVRVEEIVFANDPFMDSITKSDSMSFKIGARQLKLHTAADAAEIVTQIEAVKDLREIQFGGNTIGVEAAKALAASLKKAPTITSANLSDIFTGRLKEEIPPALDAFVDALVNTTTLREVDLSDNAFGPAGAEPLRHLIINNRSIETLRLHNNGLGIGGAKLISSAFTEAVEKAKAANTTISLHTIVMGRNRMEAEGAGHLSTAFSLLVGLRELRMPQNSIRPEGIATLMEALAGCVNLEVLDLQDNTFTTVGSKALASALPSWPKLKQLNVGDCLLQKEGSIDVLKALTPNHTELETLYLHFNEMDAAGVELIPALLANKPKLGTLTLNGNSFSPKNAVVKTIQGLLRAAGFPDGLDELDEMDFDEDEEEDEEDEDEGGDGAAKEADDDDVDDLVANMKNVKV
ncbi:hypothetical protein HK101_006031 [Irineochytrium annulatum]|nr:hypothetical protein HK101_006031 [Irineochytrium annulatum]